MLLQEKKLKNYWQKSKMLNLRNMIDFKKHDNTVLIFYDFK
jgi:hypothetical protein